MTNLRSNLARLLRRTANRIDGPPTVRVYFGGKPWDEYVAAMKRMQDSSDA